MDELVGIAVHGKMHRCLASSPIFEVNGTKRVCWQWSGCRDGLASAPIFMDANAGVSICRNERRLFYVVADESRS